MENGYFLFSSPTHIKEHLDALQELVFFSIFWLQFSTPNFNVKLSELSCEVDYSTKHSPVSTLAQPALLRYVA